MSKHTPRGAGAQSAGENQHIAQSDVERLHPRLHMKDRGAEMKAQEESVMR